MVIKQGLVILSPSTVWSAGVAVDCITVPAYRNCASVLTMAVLYLRQLGCFLEVK